MTTSQWITPIRPFKRVFIHPDSLNDGLTKRVLERIGETKINPWKDPREIYQDLVLEFVDPYAEAKQTLVIAPFKGTFVKKCPGSNTKGAVCCNYYVLNFMSQCPFDCSYCYLQDYLTNPLLFIYTNVEGMLLELEEKIKLKNDKLRVGTGELADSLATDHLTDFSLDICELFDRYPHASLELKTKSKTIDNLLKRKGRENISISWSMNPSSVQQKDEALTATIKERCLAARAVLDHGYSIAFHFDPLIDVSADLYEETFRMIAEIVGKDALKWISLGSLRMTEGLKEAMNSRFPESNLTLSEFIKSLDGKYRYAKPIRVEIFKTMYRLINEYGLSQSPIYLCMESRDAWDKALGGTPTKHPLFGIASV